MNHPSADSPGVPPSATAHELFRGFSYVAPTLNTNGSGSAISANANANCNSNNVEDQDSIATVVEVNTKHSVASRINVVSLSWSQFCPVLSISLALVCGGS